LILPIAEIAIAAARAHVVRLDLCGQEFAYQAGQSVLLGTQGVSKRRAYSLASAPGEAKREGRLELLVGTDEAGTLPLGLPWTVGAKIDVEGPIGSLTLPAEHKPPRMLFIAGGTGVAPLYAMVRDALTVSHVGIGLIYSARTLSEFAYATELSALARNGCIELRGLVTREMSDSAPFLCSKGRLDRSVLEQFLRVPPPLCFICGPTPFVCAATQLLLAMGVPRNEIRIEDHIAQMFDTAIHRLDGHSEKGHVIAV
jgi:ferredoxin-NADP reductase